MNDQKLEIAKSNTKEKLPKLKRDIDRLNECVTIFEKFLSDGTLDNWKEFEYRIDKISDSMELLEL